MHANAGVDFPQLVLQWKALSEVSACDLLIEEMARRQSTVEMARAALELKRLRDESQDVLTGEFIGLEQMPISEAIVRPIAELYTYLQGVLDDRSAVLDAYEELQRATFALLSKLKA